MLYGICGKSFFSQAPSSPQIPTRFSSGSDQSSFDRICSKLRVTVWKFWKVWGLLGKFGINLHKMGNFYCCRMCKVCGFGYIAFWQVRFEYWSDKISPTSIQIARKALLIDGRLLKLTRLIMLFQRSNVNCTNWNDPLNCLLRCCELFYFNRPMIDQSMPVENINWFLNCESRFWID